MYNQDNLGIYDNNNDNANNSANIQGVSFMDYRTKFTKTGSDEHKLLTKSSSPTVGSIIEAMNGTNSTGGYQSAAEQTLSADEAAFNALLTQYTTAYNSYVSSRNITINNATNGTPPSTTDSSNNAIIEANLQALNDQLLALATKIVGEINALKTTNSSLRGSIADKQTILMQRIADLKAQRDNFDNVNKKYDIDSVDGAIETTTLNVDAYYVHYIVYFFIGVILIVFIFNMSINPEADTTRATFFIMALLSVYIISRYVNK